MTHWSLHDIAWHKFDKDKATPEIISLVKAACLVEYNGRDYARYLCEVFSDEVLFQESARQWAEEETQHGMALRAWAELADPDFNFDAAFRIFTDGYQLPTQVKVSSRGSQAGELIARCMVEIGTSSYYTAIKDYTDEPVLKELCGKIAADEFRHYKMFYTYLQHSLEKHFLGRLQRCKVLIGRIVESSDDELAYAFYAAHEHASQNDSHHHYDRKRYAKRYLHCLGSLYRREHIDRMVVMAFKTAGLKPHTLLNDIASHLAWRVMQLQMIRVRI